MPPTSSLRVGAETAPMNMGVRGFLYISAYLFIPFFLRHRILDGDVVLLQEHQLDLVHRSHPRRGLCSQPPAVADKGSWVVRSRLWWRPDGRGRRWRWRREWSRGAVMGERNMEANGASISDPIEPLPIISNRPAQPTKGPPSSPPS